MPYANSQGVRIHYEVEGVGPPLILQHGTTDSLQTWRDLGYADVLKADYRLILVDARGHGESDKPHKPEAYTAERHAADIVSVLADLKLSRAHFFGYSMGGWIAFGMAQYAAKSVHGLIVGAASPNPPAPTDPMLEALQQQGVEAIPGTWGVPIPPALKARLLTNDVEALVANRTQRLSRPGLTAILPQMAMPCLLFCGEADPVFAGVQGALSLMPNATFFSLPGLGHAETFFRSDLVLPHVQEFLRRVSRYDWR